MAIPPEDVIENDMSGHRTKEILAEQENLYPVCTNKNGDASVNTSPFEQFALDEVTGALYQDTTQRHPE